MSTSPLSEVDRILQTTAQMLQTAEQKTKQENLSHEALTNYAASLNTNLNNNLNELQNVKWGSVKLNQELKQRVNNVLSIIASFNANRQMIESTASLRTTLSKLERVLKNFKVGEKVEAVDQDPL